MPFHRRRPYRLTHELISQHAGAVMMLDPIGFDRVFRLYDDRPGAQMVAPIWHSVPSKGVPGARTEGEEPETTGRRSKKEAPAPPLVRIEIHDVLEQRAGYHEPCSGWTDGHDAIAERFMYAFETSDVLVEFDTPGGAAAGLEQNVDRVVAAKKKYGRRVTGYVNELCASAGLWWAMCVCDEIWGPAAMRVGSIGARGGAISIARSLQREGVDFRYYTWPGPGKVAFAPELPISTTTDERGNRDIVIAGKRFARALVRSDLGRSLGLTYDEIIKQNADVYPGELAVQNKLVNGIASLEEVEEMAWNFAVKED